MQPSSITVRVSPETAKAYRAAPERDKQIAQELLDLIFSPVKPVSLGRFRKLAEAASQEARSKGLTEAKLKEILEDNSRGC